MMKIHTFHCQRYSGIRLTTTLLLSIPLVSIAAPMPPALNLSELDGTTGFVARGIEFRGNTGDSVSNAGDVNGDGVDDLIIGANGVNQNTGQSYVLFGGSGVVGAHSFDLSTLNGSNGFVINGIDEGDRSGRSVSAAGDINGDGVDDLIIGASNGDPNGSSDAGESYVVFGSSVVGSSGSLNLSSLDGSNGFVINGIDEGDFAGGSVSAAGDINDDGVDDLIIGAFAADPDGNFNAGESYVVFGSNVVGSSGSLNLSGLDGSNGFVLNGIDFIDFAGTSVSAGGDINGDGVDDLIIGADNAGPGSNAAEGEGESYVVFGGSGVGSAGSLDLGSLDGSNGFVLNGINRLDKSGASVSTVGDINDDGVADLIIGAEEGDPDGRAQAGESYVVFGGSGVGSTGSLDLASLDGSNGFVINGIDPADRSGFSVSTVGDVNGDGVSDVIIGAPRAAPNNNLSGGESYLIFGGSGVGNSGVLNLSDLDGNNGFVLNGIDAGDQSGGSVNGAGDFNDDGVVDVVIGAPSADVNGLTDAGEGYVVFMPLPDTAEPNDSLVDATPISVGQTLSNSLAPLGDIDLFTFTLTEPEQLVIRTFNDGTEQDFDTRLDLLQLNNPFPFPLTVALASNDDFGGSLYSQISIELGAGEYFVQVSSPNFDKVIPSYSVSVERAQLCQGQLVTVNLQNGETPTNGDDVILGTPEDDVIDARGGNDVVCGEAGDDTLLGRGGDDILDGGPGVDGIRGGAGNDTIFTGTGATVGAGVFVSGDDGNDTLNGGADADDLRGGDGDDVINGDAGADRMSGGEGNDTLNGGNGRDFMRGQSGNDVLRGQGLNDTLLGGSGDDTLSGGLGNDQLRGESGNDRLIGGQGNDILRGDGGDDTLLGGDGNDGLIGGANTDTCDGQNGVDRAAPSCETVVGVP